MSTQASTDHPESLHFPFLSDNPTIATVKESKTFFIIRGLPGSGKSTLAKEFLERYKDACRVISADKFNIKPEVRRAVPDTYHRFDNEVVNCSQQGTSVIVLDDTHHEKDRLDQLLDVADQYQFSVVIVEPKVPWHSDCFTLAQKNHWGLSVEELKNLKATLDTELIPLYYGWFLSRKSADLLWKTKLTFLERLASLKAFRKRVKDFGMEETKRKMNLPDYFSYRPNVLHCTTKFTDYGKAPGSEHYTKLEAVKTSNGKAFSLTITALFVTPRTTGARIQLGEQELLLWPTDAEKEVLPLENLPRGSRAHITLGCAQGVENKQTGLDLLEFVKFQQAGTEGEDMGELGDGMLRYFDKGLWMLTLSKKIEVKAIFSGYYGKKTVMSTEGGGRRDTAFSSCTVM
ncbi:2',3'-cyclic-nucleotide 3'-phosphodiesterase isoform X2 [Microcaecilia unicolor]|nr:2',3'-cyclic-nucleotide 3'-phosphodiesterase isoform X2 [Microcaecilia unicolor]XP_030077197.1 2',3'-cyclic-nucleotide 3'-phosphodiesterase isoform X2 [Microcaecilia unicolor]XP_030077198.1 2',3'-cyclic-nucleotide 3'-phosphodiesterase isoform X2 [Microcaecilia unicolor]XP_030077199.1 2',3'-cyclic-nucleotide 3'-phosphodiesterase isoform X2 [Microcaecilia unicolor]